jgi:hypothetical protein
MPWHASTIRHHNRTKFVDIVWLTSLCPISPTRSIIIQFLMFPVDLRPNKNESSRFPLITHHHQWWIHQGFVNWKKLIRNCNDEDPWCRWLYYILSIFLSLDSQNSFFFSLRVHGDEMKEIFIIIKQRKRQKKKSFRRFSSPSLSLLFTNFPATSTRAH